MTSIAKVRANRANARASTGPKSTLGRARSAQNALRHALNRPVCADPSLSEEVEKLACEIAGPHPNPEILQIARRVAEAQIDVLRVRYTRLQFMSDKLREPYYEPRASRRTKVSVLCKLLGHNPDIPAEMVAPFLTATPQGPEKFSLILVQEIKQLRAFDRYERRALSRRKFAIRDLDGARARLDPSPDAAADGGDA